MKLTSAVFQDFSCSTKNQYHCPANTTKIERLITLVKD
jgi:hypothetical protein